MRGGMLLRVDVGVYILDVKQLHEGAETEGSARRSASYTPLLN
jgi:hypothetical protein